MRIRGVRPHLLRFARLVRPPSAEAVDWARQQWAELLLRQLRELSKDWSQILEGRL